MPSSCQATLIHHVNPSQLRVYVHSNSDNNCFAFIYLKVQENGWSIEQRGKKWLSRARIFTYAGLPYLQPWN
jgi:hypothetical protein